VSKQRTGPLSANPGEAQAR